MCFFFRVGIFSEYSLSGSEGSEAGIENSRIRSWTKKLVPSPKAQSQIEFKDGYGVLEGTKFLYGVVCRIRCCLLCRAKVAQGVSGGPCCQLWEWNWSIKLNKFEPKTMRPNE